MLAADTNVRYTAMIIGNNAYNDKALPKLHNAISDATAVAQVFQNAGVGVSSHLDANRQTINRARGAFADAIKDGGAGIFWFSGHGIQISGRNFLLPIDVELEREESIFDDGIDLDDLVRRWALVRPRALILVIDACRTTLFTDSRYRAIISSQGLADMQRIPPGVLVVYSAGANQRAIDNLGPTDAETTSLFTREFLRLLTSTPAKEFRTLVHEVRGAVHAKARAVGHEQMPAVYDQLLDYVVLSPGGTLALIPPMGNRVEQVVKEWGLQDIARKEQHAFIVQIEQTLAKRIADRAFELLDDEQLAQLDLFFEGKDVQLHAFEMRDWLRNQLSNFEKLEAEELHKLKLEFSPAAKAPVTEESGDRHGYHLMHVPRWLAYHFLFCAALFALFIYLFPGQSGTNFGIALGVYLSGGLVHGVQYAIRREREHEATMKELGLR